MQNALYMLLVVLFVEEPEKPPSSTKPTNAEESLQSN